MFRAANSGPNTIHEGITRAEARWFRSTIGSMTTATPLLSVAALTAALQGDHPPRLLDVRLTMNGPTGRDAYLAGHLPGAVFVDVDQDLAAAPGAGGRHPLLDGPTLQVALRRLGVDNALPVVVYDAGTSAMAAARAWWCIRDAGHADVQVLDGGVAAWQAAGLALTTAVPVVSDGDVDVVVGSMARVDADGAAQLAAAGRLLDARAPARYRGEIEPLDPVAGHIPGARNLPNAELLDNHGRFLDAAELRDRFATATVGPLGEGPIGAYCGSGVTAAQLVLAAAVAGIDIALYPGSWSEWITDPNRPVERQG